MITCFHCTRKIIFIASALSFLTIFYIYQTCIVNDSKSYCISNYYPTRVFNLCGDKQTRKDVNDTSQNLIEIKENIRTIEEYFHENITSTNKVRHTYQFVVGKMMRNSIIDDNGIPKVETVSNPVKFNSVKFNPATLKNNKDTSNRRMNPSVINVHYTRTNDISASEISKQRQAIYNGNNATSAINKNDNNETTDESSSEEITELSTDSRSQDILPSIKYKRFQVEMKGIIKFTEITCEPIYPKVILYNRIFKTGSSSIENYVFQIANQSNFAVYRGTTENWYNNDDQYPYPELIEYQSKKNDTSAFIAHFYFRKYFDIDKSFTYINILRHPVSRIISHYNYMREETLRPKYRIKELKESGYWNESIMNCIINQHKGCEDNVMIRFLCGTNSYCKTGSKKALKRAKFNMNRYYTSIGIYENLPLTLRLLKKRLPTFFTSLNKSAMLNKVKVNTHKPKSYNTTIKNFILKRNRADMKLYKYALKRFNEEIRACLL